MDENKVLREQVRQLKMAVDKLCEENRKLRFELNKQENIAESLRDQLVIVLVSNP